MNFLFYVLFFAVAEGALTSIFEVNEVPRGVGVHAVSPAAAAAIPHDKFRQSSSVAKCICPSNDPVENSSAVVDALKKKTVNHMWAKTSPVFVGDQLRMKEIILKMLNSDVPLWRTTAFFSTNWLWSYLPSAGLMPQMCAFAQMINATVAWEISKNAAILADAIDQVALTLANSAVFAGNNIIKAAGCTPTEAMFRDTQCFQKGFSYQIEELWKNSGSMMPCAYERITKHLYHSNLYADRLMALMGTISVSQPFSEVADSIDERLMYETMQFQNIMPIPACCCKGLIVKIKEISHLFSLETTKAAAIVKSKYSKHWDRKKNLQI